MPQIHKNFEVHDKYQFEVKLDYWLKSSSRDDYQVDLFLFLPNSLGLNQQSYPPEAFYDDIKNHVRLKTPELSLTQAASDKEGRPGRLLNDSLTKYLASDGDPELSLVVEYHCKLYVSIAVRALHNRSAACLSDLDQGSFKSTRESIREIEASLEMIRDACTRLSQSDSDERAHRLATVLSSADEYLTFESSQILLKLLTGTGSRDRSLKNDLLEAIKNQSQHRSNKGYPELVLDSDGHDETVLFRRSIFKKFFRSPLFLSQSRQIEGRMASQVAMGLAAGLSMIFATLIAFLAQRHFGNFTLPLFVALVVGYIFKDRIKELTKIYLEKWLSRHVSDSKTHFFDQDGRRMGVCRETVRFRSPRQVPPEILTLRNKDHLTEIANFWHAEQIIHYRKNVSLFRSPLGQANPGYKTTAVNDIIRYNVRRLLWNMDEPEKELLALDDSQTVGKVAGARVYKVNLLLRLGGKKEEQLLRFRLILDRDGIRRMEKVDSL